MKSDNYYIDALVILFFISGTRKTSVRLDDSISDFFSSGWRADCFIYFCEDLKLYIMKSFLLPGEGYFVTVFDYCDWYATLIIKSKCDKIILRKWINYQLLQDYTMNSCFLYALMNTPCVTKLYIYIKKHLLKKNTKTTLQNWADQKRKILKIIKNSALIQQ